MNDLKNLSHTQIKKNHTNTAIPQTWSLAQSGKSLTQNSAQGQTKL